MPFESFIYLLLFLFCCIVTTILFGYYLSFVYQKKLNFLSGFENLISKLSGLDISCEMTWGQYTKAILLSNFIAAIVGFLFLTTQKYLPLNSLSLGGMEPLQAFNTACSFITNTNWQSYSGEVALSVFSQMAVITGLMFIGASSGIAVCIGFIRGLTGTNLGNFYSDFIKTIVYVLLPISLVLSLFFVSQGVPQTITQKVTVQTLEGATQNIAVGPVSSLLAIKQLGTNGGGYFNANSSHPFENPSSLTNFVEILLELAIPMALVFLLGLWLKDKKQAWAIWISMMFLFLSSLSIGYFYESQGNIQLNKIGIEQTSSDSKSLGNMEGKEARFDLIESYLFVNTTTATSTGAVNTMHDSLTPIGGMIPLLNMMLNITFGGVGVGLMGYLLYGIIAVFITGLMVGRTPEIFGKKIEKPEIILATIAILLHPILILIPTAISCILPIALSSLNNIGPHGLSEILYAFASAAANNGSAFAGLNANTPWFNITIGIVTVLGRYISIIALLAIAYSLSTKKTILSSSGTLKTNTLLFSIIWVGTILIISALTFIPVLTLGPIAEHLAMVNGKLY